MVSDRAWDRVFTEKKREITRLVEKGTLKGRRRGRGLTVEAGSFYDWLGEEVPVFPEWGFRYEIVPDADSDRLSRLREERARAKEAARKSPTGFAMRSVLRRLEWTRDLPKEPVGWGDELAESLVERVKQDLVESWQELAAVDRVLAEVQEEFEGEDPLHPRAREVLETARRELSEAHEGLQEIAGEVDLPDPGDEQVERVRGLLPRAPKGWTLRQ